MAERTSSHTVAGAERFLRSASDRRFFGALPILKTLGEGAFGAVHLVMSNGVLPRLMALKTIKASDATTEARDSFRLEAGRWVSLGSHPNIVTAYDVLTPEGAVGVLCDYIAPDEHGRTSLQDWIDAGAVTDDRLVSWSLDFCAGMAHAYAHGLTAHRDIKPDNLLIDDSSLCVADFGLATAARLLAHSAAGRDLSPAGSRPFMPPEQFIPRYPCDQRSDIYAFGVTLYSAVTGGDWPIAPANVDDVDAWMFAHARNPVRPLRHFLWPVIERCLRKRPEQRFATVDELRDAVQQAAARVGMRAEPRRAEHGSGNWEWLKLEHQAHSLALLGYEQESMQLYDRAFALHDAPLLWQSKANALLALGRLEPALECVMVALERSDDGQANWYILGDVLRRLNQHEHAVMAYEQALQKLHERTTPGADRIEAQIRHVLSLSLCELGDYVRAQSEIGKAIALQPRELVYRQVKTELLLQAGKNSAALWEVDSAEPYAPNDWQLCLMRVEALMNLGRREEALQAATRSVELAPHDPRHLSTYAQILGFVRQAEVLRVCAAFENALAHAEPHSEVFDEIVEVFQQYLNRVGEHERMRKLMFDVAAKRI